MSTIITKFSDYRIQSIEYFIDRIYTELQIRDLPGLFNNKIEIIKPTKQHPLATLMAVSLQDEGNPLRSGIIPAISVTPGDLTDIGFTLGQSFQPEVIDDDWIEDLQEYSGKGSREILEDLIITQKQIDLIVDTYEALESPEDMRVQKTEWRKDEIINVSVWSDSADIDMILGNLMDSILADIQVGFYGDNSKLMNTSTGLIPSRARCKFRIFLFNSFFKPTSYICCRR